MKKTALVTGAASGIGRAAAEKLISMGWSVVGLSRRPHMEDPIQGDFTYVSGDVSCREDRQRFLDTALSLSGHIDGLVNVAGIAPKVRRDLLEMTEESYDQVMEINTKGTLFLTQQAALRMLENPGPQKGAIVNVSSMSAYTSSVSRGEYCISKAGVSMITRLFADRLAGEGIPVNEVRPGIIATDMTAKVKGKYDALIADGLLPMPRWGQPQDVAAAICALLNGSLPYVTGQSIDVDGGFHIQRL